MDSHLASPSKARAHALESHSWSLVTSFLSNLYAPAPPPVIERNSTTLAALQGLLHAHGAAETERKLVHAARLAEAEALRAEESRSADEDLLGELEASLASPASDALDSLARSALALGLAPGDGYDGDSTFDQLTSALPTLTAASFALQDQISRVDTLTQALEAQVAALQSQMSPLQSPSTGEEVEEAVTPDSSPAHSRQDTEALHAQTQQFIRETKQLTLKASEYRDRVAALERQAALRANDGPSVADVAAAQAKVDAMRKDVVSMEAKLKMFHGLPPDVEASRAEVKRLQGEVEGLRRRRDDSFESMTG